MSTTVSPSDIEAAAARIASHVRCTPVLALTAGEVASFPVVLKLESLQHGGSFKVRGAFNTLLSSDLPAAGVIAASGGNHGIAVALAAERMGIRAEIFVPTIAAAVKVARLEAHGAQVTQTGADYAEALLAMRFRQEATGALEIHAYDQPSVIAGQGTLARELEAQSPEMAGAVIAVGGGGLIAGALAWMGGRRPIHAVEPEGAPTLARALEAGHVVDVAVGGVAADSLGARRIGTQCLELAQRHDVDVALVPDSAINEAQRWLYERCRLVVEPGGAVALAAVMTGQVAPTDNRPLAVVVCGGNADVRGLAT